MRDLRVEDVSEIINLLGTTDVTKWPITDQLIYFAAVTEFADKIADVVKRNTLKEALLETGESSTFIMKL